MTSAETPGPLPPAGWFDDPAGSAELRWWSGEAWTDHLTPRPTDEQEQAGYQPLIPMNPATTSIMYRAPAASPVYRPTGWSTPGAWVVAASPLLLLVAGVLAGLVIEAVPESSPAALGILVLPIAIVVAAAVRDRKRLYGLGYVKAATPTWLLLGPVGYLIARTVHVHRESGRGIAPLVFFLVCGLVVGVGASVASLSLGLALAPQRTATIEREIEQDLASRGGQYTVDCPTVTTLDVGTTFTCSTTSAQGDQGTARVTITSSSGSFRYVFDPGAPASNA